jgi:transposase
MPSLADRLVPDQLWKLVEPLLPPRPPHANGGRPREIPDRACFAAIVFMARTSTPWELLPARELGCGSASTAYRRFAAWTRAGVFDQLALVLLDKLGEAGRIDWRRVSVDSTSLRALKKGGHTGPNPTDRGKAGSKLHLAADGGGIPLAVLLTAANLHDSTLFHAVLDEIPPVATPTGRRRRRPGPVHADKAYDHQRCRAYLHKRGITTRIARRGIESSQRLGRHRWKAERTIAWLLGCRRLRVRFDRCDERFFAFALLACSLICYRTLHIPPW